MRRRGTFWVESWVAWAATLCVAVAGCAGTPGVSAPDRSAAWGYIELVPREGLDTSGARAYGDRRVGQAELVEASRPGSVVVYLSEGEATSSRNHALRIVDGRVRTHFEPAFLAVRAGDSLEIENASESPRLLSSPIAGLLRRLAPGQRLRVEMQESGEYELFVLDGVGASSVIFVAPGPLAVSNDTGRYVIEDIAPGRHQLHTWHPRFPPTMQSIDLPAGIAQRVDIRLGVGQSGEGANAARGARNED
jgi:hypothetical protein